MMEPLATERPDREELYRQIMDAAAEKAPANAQARPQIAPAYSFYFPWQQYQVPANGSTSAETTDQ